MKRRIIIGLICLLIPVFALSEDAPVIELQGVSSPISPMTAETQPETAAEPEAAEPAALEETAAPENTEAPAPENTGTDGEPIPIPVDEGTEAEKPAESGSFFTQITDFLQGETVLFGLKAQTWVFVAAGAGLLLLILLIVLLATRKGRRRKKGDGSIDADLPDMPQLHTSQAVQAGQEGGQMLSLDDEPTVNLNTEPAAFGQPPAGQGLDETVNLIQIQLRLFHGDEYMDTELRLRNGETAYIGRGSDVSVQTNPADISVSHKHGCFSVQNGEVFYTDTSRNGSRLNGLRTLANGESVQLPYNTRSELEIGNHRVWIIAKK